MCAGSRSITRTEIMKTLQWLRLAMCLTAFGLMAVRSKVNVNRKNLIMSLADSCFEFLRDLEKEHDPDLVRRRAAEFTEDVRHYSRLIELT